MKKTITAALMFAWLFMGAMCGGVEISGPAVIALIQQECGIVVPIADISALVTANPTLVTVAEVANAICSAFKAQQAKAPAASPSGQLIVNGVLVHYVIK